jgi:hypothetical protein
VGPGSISDPKPLSYFTNNNPNAVITQISLDNGGTTGGSGTFAASVDDLVLGTNGDHTFTRYDFSS